MEISISTNLPPRILQTSILPKSPAPATNLIYVDTVCWNGTNTWSPFEKTLAPEWRCVYFSQMRLLQSLQGLVNRHHPQIYLADTWYQMISELTQDYWWPVLMSMSNRFAEAQYIQLNYNVTNSTPPANALLPILDVVTQFVNKSYFDGILLYNTNLYRDVYNAHIMNYITTFCAVSNCLAMSFDQYDTATNLYGCLTNFPVKLSVTPQWWDARGMTNGPAVYQAMIQDFWPQCSKKVLAQWHPHAFIFGQDYLIAHKIMPVRWQDKVATPEEINAVLDPLLDDLYVHGGIIGDWGAQETMFRAVANGQTQEVNAADALYYGLNWEIQFTNVNHRGAPAQMTEEEPNDFDVYTTENGNTIYELILNEGEEIADTEWLFSGVAPATNYNRFSEKEGLAELGTNALTIQYTYNCNNFSLHSGIKFEDLEINRPEYTAPQFDSNKIYTTFIWSDGDNIMWDKQLYPRIFSANNWKAHAFGAGFGINPMLCELAPVMVKWLIENAPENVEPMFSGGIGITETETYGMKYGKQKADELLREHYQLAKKYADHAGITVINPQHYTKYRGCNIAVEVFTNALLIIPGIVDTYYKASPEGHLNTNWMSGNIPIIAPVHRAIYAVSNMVEESEINLLFPWESSDPIWNIRPQFWNVPILGNRVFSGAASDLYYEHIGTKRLFDTTWQEDYTVQPPIIRRVESVPPSVLGEFYRVHGGE